ncbi:isopentenyl-diphosphate Delta-isomerase [Clostridium sp. 19966]|uniref:isopentenyl-diphosphate Delta-isomerase n=1 Tax=Clostridium sp. 19966 TaxID=2768166 RepID=UPI0028DE6740|nr:isopentenyl-diphosphate Delta-isomerase [Clostridium sp. 19966]MDT8719236.1 isopentenyl-diphosphate Delta-isomerase [Clostridium sp. 19966]
MLEYIIAVDKDDREIGAIEKLEAHKRSMLHRAFSIFVFNSKKELLLQKRHSGKYHSAGLWSNTCCSHPRYGEALQEAAYRRLREEMGFTCEIKDIFSFTYTAKLENNLVENEFDHVFIGYYDGEVSPDENEVEGYKWSAIDSIKSDILENPDAYTFWFKLIFDRVAEAVEQG